MVLSMRSHALAVPSSRKHAALVLTACAGNDGNIGGQNWVGSFDRFFGGVLGRCPARLCCGRDGSRQIGICRNGRMSVQQRMRFPQAVRYRKPAQAFARRGNALTPVARLPFLERQPVQRACRLMPDTRAGPTRHDTSRDEARRSSHVGQAAAATGAFWASFWSPLLASPVARSAQTKTRLSFICRRVFGNDRRISFVRGAFSLLICRFVLLLPYGGRRFTRGQPLPSGEAL